MKSHTTEKAKTVVENTVRHLTGGLFLGHWLAAQRQCFAYSSKSRPCRIVNSGTKFDMKDPAETRNVVAST